MAHTLLVVTLVHTLRRTCSIYILGPGQDGRLEGGRGVSDYLFIFAIV